MHSAIIGATNWDVPRCSHGCTSALAWTDDLSLFEQRCPCARRSWRFVLSLDYWIRKPFDRCSSDQLRGPSPNIRRVPIFGLGCVAGAAGISLAGAVIIAGAERGLPGPQIVGTRSVFYPYTEDVMGWGISEKGFKIVLSPGVPDMVRFAFLRDFGLKRADIGAWAIHSGGPKVLEAIEESLDLPEGALNASWECLRETGNLSSASVLVVLEKFMRERRPAPGAWSGLAAMGPGFCSELVLLRW